MTLHVGQHKLKCLLDSGASHSFVAANIIHELGLKTRFADALEVALADNSVVCLREVVDLPVHFACNATARNCLSHNSVTAFAHNSRYGLA